MVAPGVAGSVGPPPDPPEPPEAPAGGVAASEEGVPPCGVGEPTAAAVSRGLSPPSGRATQPTTSTATAVANASARRRQ